MRKNHLIIFFLVILAGNIIGIGLPNELLEKVTKPLLMPVLAVCFFSQTKRTGSSLKKWVLLALFFSWAGDVLLMFQDKRAIFFLLGLSSFLLAHLCYILFFHALRIREKIKGNPWLLIIVVVYYAGLIYFLSPYLADMKWPVRVYGIVISFMFMLAMHMLYLKNNTAGKWMMAGALLFVLSDSTLAINKFYQPFEGAGMLIILTYGLAQLFIVNGAIKYIRN